MQDFQIFSNQQFGQVRALQKDGQSWFVGKDIADVLGYSETNAMTKRLDEEDFISDKLEGMNMKSTLINESGLYAAVLGSHLPTAKKFKRWVTSEVLPSIRKHGAYMTENVLDEVINNPDFGIKLLTELKKEKEEKKLLQKQMEKDKPKVLFADAVSTSHTSILVGELAKILKQNGVEMGQNRFFVWLRDNGYLIKRKGTDYNMPTQYSMDLGLFEVKETSITHSDGHISISKTSKITGKGQMYFINKFIQEKRGSDYGDNNVNYEGARIFAK